MARPAPHTFFRLAGVVIATFVVSCSSRSPLVGPPDAKLGYSEVNTLAIEAAKANGIVVAEYNQPVLNFEKSRVGSEWRVAFTMLSPARPGGHFAVLINDGTKQSRFEPGE